MELTAQKRKELTAILEQVRAAQSEFWNALADLEQALDAEVEAADDYESTTVEMLWDAAHEEDQ